MNRTWLYVLGILALHFTDFSHPQAFFSLVLPVIDAVFLCFLMMEFTLFVTDVGFSADDYNIYDLCRDVLNLRYDIAEQGLLQAVVSLSLIIVDAVLMVIALVYAFDLAITAAVAG